MPQINLLAPGEKKKDGKKKEPQEKKASAPAQKIDFSQFFSQLDFSVLELSQAGFPLIIRTSVSLGVCLLIWGILIFGISRKEKALFDLENKTNVLTSNPKEYEKLHSEQIALEKKNKLIENLSSRKFLWYEKLNQIGAMIPDGIWLTDITSKIVEKDPIADKGSKTLFIIKGMAVAYKIDDAVALIGDFIKKLQENSDFSKDFVDIKLNNIAKGTIGGLDVMRFDFLCETE